MVFGKCDFGPTQGTLISASFWCNGIILELCKCLLASITLLLVLLNSFHFFHLHLVASWVSFVGLHYWKILLDALMHFCLNYQVYHSHLSFQLRFTLCRIWRSHLWCKCCNLSILFFHQCIKLLCVFRIVSSCVKVWLQLLWAGHQQQHNGAVVTCRRKANATIDNGMKSFKQSYHGQ